MEAYTENEPLSCNLFMKVTGTQTNPKSILRNCKLKHSIPSLLLWEHGNLTFSYLTLLVKPYSPNSDNGTYVALVLFSQICLNLWLFSFPALPRLPSLIILMTQIALASFHL